LNFYQAALQLSSKAFRKKEAKPFIYFDFAYQGLFYTDPVIEFLGLQEPLEFSSVLDYIGGKREIYKSFRGNSEWTYCNCTTKSQEPLEIRMAMYPFSFAYEGRERNVGVGTLFYKQTEKDRKFRIYRKAIEDVSAVLKDLGEKMQDQTEA